MRRCVWSRNLTNDEAMARVGPQRHEEKSDNKYSPTQLELTIITHNIQQNVSVLKSHILYFNNILLII